MARGRGGDKERAESGCQNGLAGNMADVREGRRCPPPEAIECGGDDERSERKENGGNGSKFLEGKDGEDKRLVHSLYPTAAQAVSTRVGGVLEVEERGKVPFQRGARGPDQRGPQEGEPEAGTAVAEARGDSGPRSYRPQGRGAPPLQRPHECDDVAQVPQLWEGLGGGHATGLPGAGSGPVKQPTTVEVAAAFGTQERVPKSLLPLHLKKHVSPIDTKKLLGLGNKTPECRVFLQNALAWLNDGSRYGATTLRPKKPRFSEKHFREMLGYKYKPLYGVPEGFVDAFVRTEPSKNPEHTHKLRLRPLFAPDANETGATREMLQTMRMRTKGEIREQGAESPELVIQFDMESYYDQFQCSESVKKKMCFCGPDGLVYALERLPMGLRPACEVAQATTWFLLDFEMGPSVKITTCIDNIRFLGKKTEVVDAVKIFLNRCREVGAQLDRWPKSDDTQGIVEMGGREGDFLGENYNYDRSTRKLTTRSVDKLKMIKSWFDGWKNRELQVTARQMGVVMGMFFWTAAVLDIPLFLIISGSCV